MKPLFDAKEFGRKLRMKLADLNIDVRSAAKKIGVSPATISRVCCEKSPDVENYLRIKKWIENS